MKKKTWVLLENGERIFMGNNSEIAKWLYDNESWLIEMILTYHPHTDGIVFKSEYEFNQRDWALYNHVVPSISKNMTPSQVDRLIYDYLQFDSWGLELVDYEDWIRIVGDEND